MINQHRYNSPNLYYERERGAFMSSPHCCLIHLIDTLLFIQIEASVNDSFYFFNFCFALICVLDDRFCPQMSTIAKSIATNSNSAAVPPATTPSVESIWASAFYHPPPPSQTTPSSSPA